MHFSEMAGTLIGSEVLKIAGEINALKATGKPILNFTVGDFDPNFFPIPEFLKTHIQQALQKNQTNYPPSSGIMNLRQAVADFYTREFKVETSPDEVLIAGGARPLIYTVFMGFLNPGDRVLYPVPSWNNNHYAHLARAQGIALECKVENGFLPTAAEITPHLDRLGLLCLNSPLNPTGTAFREKTLREICELAVNENRQRAARKQSPLYVMYDQIYWKITHEGTRHFHPLQICPELKPWLVIVDGISKYFCSTGLRVGWSIQPKAVTEVFSNILGHIGAWAPKPEQMAVAEFLADPNGIEKFVGLTNKNLERRLVPLCDGVMKLKQKGLPVDAVRPQGGIYLSVKVGRKSGGARTDEEMRKALLNEVGVAVVPFQAFGLKRDTGWFRLSVGAVSEADVAEFLRRLETFAAS